MAGYKVPVLGTYPNVSSGTSIAGATRKLLRNDSIAYSEKFGQALVDHGVLRPVGQISNKFQGAATSYYQWQPVVFELVSDPLLSSATTSPALDQAASGFGELTLQPPRTRARTGRSETREEAEGPDGSKPERGSAPAPLTPRLDRDRSVPPASAPAPVPEPSPESDAYLDSVLELDTYRCTMEVDLLDVFEYVEKCELERIAALRDALAAFAALSADPASERDAQARALAAARDVAPRDDLAALVNTYRMGPFIPTVTVFRAANNAVVQTFGVELDESQFFFDATLRHIEGMKAPVTAWTARYNLREVYKLRASLNTGRRFDADAAYQYFTPELVVGVLKQYLLELPESVIPFPVYDRVKELYEDLDREREMRLGQKDGAGSAPGSAPGSLRSTKSTGPDAEMAADAAADVSAATGAEPDVSAFDEQLTDALADVLEHTPLKRVRVFARLVEVLAGYKAPAELGAALAWNLFRPRAMSIITQRDTHPRRFVSDVLARADTLLPAMRLRIARETAPSDAPRTPSRAISAQQFWSPHRASSAGLSATSAAGGSAPGSLGDSAAGSGGGGGKREVPGSVGLIPLNLLNEASHAEAAARPMSRHEGLNRGVGILPIGDAAAELRVPSTAASPRQQASPRFPRSRRSSTSSTAAS